MNNKHKHSFNKGFTLIEIMVSMTLIALIIPTVTTIFVTLLQQQRLLTQLSQMKREGDTIAQVVKSNIGRNTYRVASAVSPLTYQCQAVNSTHVSANGTTFFFVDSGNHNFRIFRQGTNLFLSVDGGPNTQINSGDVSIQAFNISCVHRSTYSAPYVYLNYTIAPSQNLANITPKTLFYQTVVKLNTY